MRNFFVSGEHLFAEHRLAFFGPSPDQPVPQGPEAADTPVEPDKSKVDKIDVSGTSSKEVAESAKTATKSAEAKLGKLSLGVKAETHENGDREFTAKIRVPELSKLKEGLSKFLGKGKKETPSSETKTESGKTEATQDTPKPGTEAQPDQKENVDTAAELGKNLNLSVDTIREFTNGGAPENVVNGVLEGMGALIANHDNFDEGQQAAANIVDAVNTFPLTIVGAEYKLSFDGSNFTVEMKTPAPKAAPDTKTDTQPTKPAEKPADQPLAKSDAKPADKPKAAEPKSADKKPTTPTNKPVTPRETPGKKVADAVRRSASGGGSLSDTLKNARPTPGNRAPDRGPAQVEPQPNGAEQRERILSPREALVQAAKDAMANDSALSSDMSRLYQFFETQQNQMPQTYEAMEDRTPDMYYTMALASAKINKFAFDVSKLDPKTVSMGRRTIQNSPQGTFDFMKEAMAGGGGVARGPDARPNAAPRQAATPDTPVRREAPVNRPAQSPSVANATPDAGPQQTPDATKPNAGEAKQDAPKDSPDQGAVNTLKSALGKFAELVKSQADGSLAIDLSSMTQNALVKSGLEAVLRGLGIESKDGKIPVTKQNIDSLINNAGKVVDFANNATAKAPDAAKPKTEGPKQGLDLQSQALKIALGSELSQAVVIGPDGKMQLDFSQLLDNDFAKMALPYALDALKIPHSNGKVPVTIENIATLTQNAGQIIKIVNAVRTGNLSELPEPAVQGILNAIDAQLPEKFRGKLKLDNLNITVDLGPTAEKAPVKLGARLAGLKLDGTKLIIRPGDIAKAITLLKTAANLMDRQEKKQ